MTQKSALKRIIILLNIIGIVLVFFLALTLLSHNHTIPNPDAMLPVTVSDGAGLWLTIGFPVLAITNSALFMIFKKTTLPARLLCFAPSLITLILVGYYWLSSVF